jgi:hypothetical protein
MEKDRYTVMLRYDPQNAEIHQKVTDRLAHLDPRASKQFTEAEFNGRLILKRRTDPETALRLKQLFDVTGAACDVYKVPETPVASKTGEQTAGQQGAPPLLMHCPNCGLEQTVNQECRACGIIIAKAGRRRPVTEKPVAMQSPEPAPHRMLSRLRRWSRPMLTLLQKIEHPIDVRNLTTWSKKVGDGLLRCGIVFFIALILETGLLLLGRMLWSLYVATPMGQYYVKRMPEQAQAFQSILEADPLTLGLDTTLVVLGVGLLVGCAAQILHFIRYLYDSQGIIGKLLLWFIPCTGLAAWIISQRHPYPVLPLAATLTAVPTLCMLSSCLYLARIILPELGDLRAMVQIIVSNRGAAWDHIMEKIRIWFDTTRRI